MTYFALELEAPVIRAQAEKVNLIDFDRKTEILRFFWRFQQTQPYQPLGCLIDIATISLFTQAYSYDSDNYLLLNYPVDDPVTLSNRSQTPKACNIAMERFALKRT